MKEEYRDKKSRNYQEGCLSRKSFFPPGIAEKEKKDRERRFDEWLDNNKGFGGDSENLIPGGLEDGD